MSTNDFKRLERDALARLNATRAIMRRQFEYSVLWFCGLVLLGLVVMSPGDPWGLYIIGIILTTIGAWHNGRLSE